MWQPIKRFNIFYTSTQNLKVVNSFPLHSLKLSLCHQSDIFQWCQKLSLLYSQSVLLEKNACQLVLLQSWEPEPDFLHDELCCLSQVVHSTLYQAWSQQTKRLIIVSTRSINKQKKEKNHNKVWAGEGGGFFLIIFWGVWLNGVAFLRTGVTIMGLHFQKKALKVFLR